MIEMKRDKNGTLWCRNCNGSGVDIVAEDYEMHLFHYHGWESSKEK